MASPIPGFDIGDFFLNGLGKTMIIIIIALVFLGLLGGFAWWMKSRKKYDIKVRIYSTRFGAPKTWDDLGAIYKDAKTGQANGFKLKSEKEIISPPSYKLIMMSTKGNVIHMRQDSTGHYTFLEPEFCESGFKLKVVAEDVRLWQSAQRQQVDILYTKTKWYSSLLAFLPYIIVAVLIMILIYLVLQKFEVLQGVATSLDHTATVLKDIHQSGALVSQGA